MTVELGTLSASNCLYDVIGFIAHFYVKHKDKVLTSTCPSRHHLGSGTRTHAGKTHQVVALPPSRPNAFLQA